VKQLMVKLYLSLDRTSDYYDLISVEIEG